MFRRDEDELHLEVAGILDDAHDSTRATVELPRAADRQLELCRHLVGDGDLVLRSWEPSVDYLEHGRTEDAFWVLAADGELVNRTRQRGVSETDHFDGSESPPGHVELRDSRPVSCAEGYEAVGVTEVGFGRWRQLVDERRPGDEESDGRDEQA